MLGLKGNNKHMQKFFLEKVRLSHYFFILLLGYLIIITILPKVKFDSSALTLFSVNSLLYGFYIAPILNAQRARIEDLHRIVRSEANAVFGMVLMSKKLPKELRNSIQAYFVDYLKASIKGRKPGEGEANYEKLITFCLDYKGAHKEDVDKLLAKLVENQQNRTNFSMQMNNRVFNNEWMIMLVLFSITEAFILTIDAGGGFAFKILAALLCTGLTMLLVILVKMSTLTHKKAKLVWDPYKKLVSSHFYRVD